MACRLAFSPMQTKTDGAREEGFGAIGKIAQNENAVLLYAATNRESRTPENPFGKNLLTLPHTLYFSVNQYAIRPNKLFLCAFRITFTFST
jgi:hypothetical protein